jgi:hypothetical protein
MPQVTEIVAKGQAIVRDMTEAELAEYAELQGRPVPAAPAESPEDRLTRLLAEAKRVQAEITETLAALAVANEGAGS